MKESPTLEEQSNDTLTDPLTAADYHLPGAKVLLLGASGSGKTYSILTLLEAGLEVFGLFTENSMETLFKEKKNRPDLDWSKFHYTYVSPANPSFAALEDNAYKINTLAFDALSKLSGLNKQDYGQFLNVVTACANFKDDITGEEFGPVDSWGPDRALVLDSLSGLNIMAMDLVVGGKPTKSMADWGVAMDNLHRIIQKLTLSTRCHFVLTAHLEPERDEVTGRITNMPSTLGKKLPPLLPRFFSDVIHVQKEGDRFFWSTTSANVATKNRWLPLKDDLPPSFVPLINEWRNSQ